MRGALGTTVHYGLDLKCPQNIHIGKWRLMDRGRSLGMRPEGCTLLPISSHHALPAGCRWLSSFLPFHQVYLSGERQALRLPYPLEAMSQINFYSFKLWVLATGTWLRSLYRRGKSVLGGQTGRKQSLRRHTGTTAMWLNWRFCESRDSMGGSTDWKLEDLP